MTRQKTVKWGILSCSRVAKNRWIPAMQQVAGCQIAAISSRDATKSKNWAKQFHIAKSYGDYEEMIRDPQLDAIYIGLPNTLHYQWALKCLTMGKHVLCDKPLAMTSKQVEHLYQTAKDQNLLLYEPYVNAYHSQYDQIKQWIDQERIGNIKLIRVGFSFYFDRPGDIRYNPDLGGGSLMDLGCYCVSLIRRILNKEPVQITASQVIHPMGVDWSTFAQLAFDKDVVTSFDCSFGYHGGQFLHIVGSKGSIESDVPFRAESPVEVILKNSQDVLSISFEPENTYVKCLQKFQEKLHNDNFDDQFAIFSINNSKVLEKIALAALKSQRPLD